MPLSRTFTDRLPDYVPKDLERFTDEFEFEDPAEREEMLIYRHTRGYGAGYYGGKMYGSNAEHSTVVYQLRKAPFEGLRSVRAIVDGIERELVIDEHVQAVDLTNNVRVDGIEFIDEEFYPDVGTTVVVDYVAESVISRYTGAYDVDIDAVAHGIDGSIDAKSVETAQGRELDLLGMQFGEIGRRRRRGDDEYRRFLRSVVSAYGGRGTKDDIKFAVAAATGGEPDDVTIIEDTDGLGFEVHLEDFGDITITESLRELAEIASPSGVNLLRHPVITTTGLVVPVTPSESTVTEIKSLGDGSSVGEGAVQ